MRCPFCSDEDTEVKDSRPTEDSTAIRRRRLCGSCGARFTTFERVQLRELIVVKSCGDKQIFDRNKVQHSIDIATRKRNVDADKIDQAVNGIVRQLESLGDSEISTNNIGLLVMEALRQLDKVAYIRYASVYKSFEEAVDFQEFIEHGG